MAFATDLESLNREELLALVRSQQAQLDILRAEPERPPLPQPPSAALRAAILALPAVLLAVGGEFFVRSLERPALYGVGLYAAAVLLLALTLPRFALLQAERAGVGEDALLWIVCAAGATVTLLLAGITFFLLRDNLRDPMALWLWLGGVAALLLTAAAAWRLERPTARWRANMPRGRWDRALPALAVLLLLAGAVAARVLWIDSIPYGINPDEGDRTAYAMQVVRGTTDHGPFESGWYRISMMYFYILAWALKWFGIGFVQARLFTGFFSLVAVAGITWLGMRHWNWRVGLMAGAFLAFTGLGMQFGRETSEAGPTAALWVMSIALLLEGVRGGRTLAWVGSGLAGGFSLYFYPSGRMWPLLALLFGIYLLVRWGTERNRAELLRLLRGLAMAALAAVAVTAPFLAHWSLFPHEFSLRFAETSVLLPHNAARLNYVDPTWSLPRLLAEQLGRSLGVFGRYADGGGFWPMHQPVLVAPLAVLALVGMGLSCLRWRDPRAVALAIWFWVGFVGMVLTVETPNVQRIATAFPVMGLFAALTLDELVRRAVELFQTERARFRAAAWGSLVVAGVLAVSLALEVRFYFGEYATMQLWTGWNQEGRAVAETPPGTLNTSLGSSFHMVNSGWVRLLAPDAERGGVQSPGSMLPLPEDGARGLAFMVYPNQEHYLPWLQGLYPGLASLDYTRGDEDLYFTQLYVPPEQVAATRGALFDDGRQTVTVPTLGALPSDSTPGNSPATWTATLRIPRQWNYRLRVGPGPARLLINGALVVEALPGQVSAESTVNLARGDLALTLEGNGRGHTLQMAAANPGGEALFRTLGAADLRATGDQPHGFIANVRVDTLPHQMRQDTTLALCCIAELLHAENRPFEANWESTLFAPVSGEYQFRLALPAAGRLAIGEQTVIINGDPQGGDFEGRIFLNAGSHPIEVNVATESETNRPLELVWVVPGERPSILPGEMLTLPLGAGVQPPLPDEVLQTVGAFPVDQPLMIVR